MHAKTKIVHIGIVMAALLCPVSFMIRIMHCRLLQYYVDAMEIRRS